MQNIVLIGMPGCGKSVIGKALAELMDKSFYDIDIEIEQEQGCDIQQIFTNFGESHFRMIESKIISRLSTLSHAVIATGGGAVLFDENVKNLKHNGYLIYIERSLEDILSDIDIEKRPLLKSGKDALVRLFEQRNPVYHDVADLVIKNNKPISDITNEIASKTKNLFDLAGR